jgi:hypothetical protein
MVPVLVGRGDCRMQIETSLKRQVHRGLVWKSLALIMLSVVSNLLWEASQPRLLRQECLSHIQIR